MEKIGAQFYLDTCTQLNVRDEVCCAEPSATCHKSSTEDADTFRACAPTAVVYALPPDSTSGAANETSAVWTADKGVVLDARYLFRGIHLQRDLEIRGVTLAQALSSRMFTVFLPAVLCADKSGHSAYSDP